MRFLFILAFFLFFNSQRGWAQAYQPEKINKRAINIYGQVLGILAHDGYNDAIPYLQKAIAIDSNYLDAYLSLAGVYGQLKNYKAAVYYYERAKHKDSNYCSIYNLPYSINLAGLGKFDSALVAINTFLTIPNMDEVSLKSASYRKKCYEFGVQYQNKYPHPDYQFNPINLGDSVNSAHSEYLPTFSVDDSLLVFSRRSEDGGEYFYRSNLINPKLFSKAEIIPGKLNEEPFKGAITVSADGDWMIFAADISGKTYGNFDLFLSYYTPNGWSEPENMGPNINSEFWESTPCLSPDKRVLYFSSKRTGGFGGADLYVSYRDIHGKWGKAINMGPTINSVGDEQAPFMHADNQTLYFTSNGLQGYGGTDLFVSRKGTDGSWSVPENLGYPINTIENEGSLTVAANGTDAYYASDRSDSKGGMDLYYFELRKDIQPSKTIYIKGYVYDEKTKKGLPSNVEVIDNITRKPLMVVQTDETGYYFITLPTDRAYSFNVNRKGYLFYNKLYDLNNKAADSTYRENIYLNPIVVNAKMVLHNIVFGINDYTLAEKSKVELEKIIEILKENPTITIAINGYTDGLGNKEENLVLSTNRAKEVMSYLISNGIDKLRLQCKGMGDGNPISDNTTEKGRALNRRTEIVIMGL